VDVAVIGGSTGAISAATAAAKSGASVFLAAPHPYLGDDMTATLRLWLEEGEVPESPLARAIFSERPAMSEIADPSKLLEFTYEPSLASAAPHKDTLSRSALRDGKWGSATSESVQYNGDVTITVTLAEAAEVESAILLAYHTRDFLVESVSVSTSTDGSTWSREVTVPNSSPPQSGVTEPAVKLAVPMDGRKVKHLKFSVRKGGGATRVLLGELAVVRAGPPVLAKKPEVRYPARPLHIKKTMDDALIDAGVDFLYASYVTDIVEDSRGLPSGVVIANRAGRQAVLADVIIDATHRARVARLAGAEFRPYPTGKQEFRMVVIGGEEREGLRSRKPCPPFHRSGKDYGVTEYTLELPMKDTSPASWARVEQLARNATYSESQQFTSDVLFQVPPDPVRGELTLDVSASTPVEKLDLGAFRPEGVAHLYVLGGCADVPRRLAESLLRPLALIDLGARIGKAAAGEAESAPERLGYRVRVRPRSSRDPGDVHEVLTGVRPVQYLPAIPQPDRDLPVLGSYDVVVVGGGTSGAPAGIGAARQGASTLVIEYLHGLGGVGTQGAISSYYWGNRIGFSATVAGGPRWEIEPKMEWWRRNLLDAGGEVWFGTMGCGAFVEDSRVRGIVVATPQGRGVVMAHVVIDSTGNTDIAAAAGAECLYTDATDIAMQGTGLPPRRLGSSYTNTDYTIVDETDMLDVLSIFVAAKHRAGDAFDLGRLIDTRERRRIVGDFTMSVLDQINERTYPDTVAVCYSDFDTHGYTTDPYFTLEHPPKRKGFYVRIPYRMLLPRGLDGILVTGLGISCHRDAVPLIRMQPDVQNHGYAAGAAAALAARDDVPTREIDLRELQRHLVEIGNFSGEILEEEDSYPIPRERIAAAVKAAGDGYQDISVILARPEVALPLLRVAYAEADTPEAKLIYAHILAVLGDNKGLPDLLDAVRAFEELDEGWRYTGMGQFGPNMSRLDRLIYALGRTRDRRATAPILEKLELLEPDDEFSHFRAMGLALESLGDPAAAGPLVELLRKPGVRGHASTDLEEVIETAKKHPSWTATEPRSNAIRELILARTLYRCGDRDGLGREILEEYRRDLRGHLSRHADAVLKEGQRPD
jgi:hypothetical protein